MKKSVVALAAMAVVGGASAQVTISGYFGGSVDAFSISNANAARTGNSSETRVTDNSSRLIFNVTEDLGGGMKALGQFDLRIPLDATQRGSHVCAPNAGATPTNTCVAPYQVNAGNQHVGLSGDFGAVRLGRQDIHYTEGGHFMPIGTATIQSHAGLLTTAANGQNVSRTSRSSNLLWWTTPTVMNFSGVLGYSTQSYATSGYVDIENDMASGQRKGGTTYVKAQYANGPITAVYSQINEKSDWIGTTAVGMTANAPETLWAAEQNNPDRQGSIFSAKYDFGIAKVGYARAQNTSQAHTAGSGALGVTSKRGVNQYGLGIPMGASTIAVTFTAVGNVLADGVETANTSAKATSATYAYDLSKNTQLVASYMTLKNATAATHSLFYNASSVVGSSGSTALAGEKHNVISIGTRVGF